MIIAPEMHTKALISLAQPTQVLISNTSDPNATDPANVKAGKRLPSAAVMVGDECPSPAIYNPWFRVPPRKEDNTIRRNIDLVVNA